MVEYNCNKCGFRSSNKTDYTRHCETKKHKLLVKGQKVFRPVKILVKKNNLGQREYICSHCKSNYTRKDSLKRHESHCLSKIIEEKDKLIAKYEKEIEEYKKQLKIN